MNDIEPLAMDKLGFNVVIGKGGLNLKNAEYMKEHGCCYLSTLGGCAVILAEAINEIKNVYWIKELGDTEAVWEIGVKDFGPLIVGIDAKGNSLYE
jgi:fumarate hydratase subunit beta